MTRLETKRLLLRPLQREDAEIVEEYASDYEIAKTTLNIPHPYPKGSALDYIDSVLAAAKNGRQHVFAITEKNSGSLLGTIALGIAEEHSRGELAYWVGKPHWGKGYGTEAARRLMQYGFETLQLRKIFAASFTDNPGSWRIMEKIGLKYEGTLKQHVSRLGNHHDLAYYGLLKEDYKG
ncbi:N-acetyltransferase [Anaerobacillus alkaliphilus]|uniref:N-acetyltransferase n=1 Tax=Anaerobacillus alkaliphilus TaxID=1548597 RepID=A0A4Q0VLQ4_9BACI|nr:GNAT family N-acetyltransferase [Anaerobacillus alkaliphilus]RXI96143.1 N-acetyltransferase [Anaerobacillus alkaliphilus]